MDERMLAAAAERVASCRLRHDPLARLDGVSSLDEGYAVQERANGLLEARLGRRVGHKIGGTTETMRRYIRAPEPLAGDIFASEVHGNGATVTRADFIRLGIETEIAVRLALPLPPRHSPYTRTEVGAAVGEMMAAIELVDDRYVDFTEAGAATLVADNVFGAGSVLATPATAWRRLELGELVSRTFEDGNLIATGRSDALLGHPLDALAWLANHRSARGLGLEAGRFVSLGSITPVHWVSGPATYRISVEGLGEVGVAVA